MFLKTPREDKSSKLEVIALSLSHSLLQITMAVKTVIPHGKLPASSSKMNSKLEDKIENWNEIEIEGKGKRKIGWRYTGYIINIVV